MFTLLILLIITTSIILLQAQNTPVYQNYNNYVTYRPALNLNPTFSALDKQTYTTPSPYAYGSNLYGANSQIRYWPYVIEQCGAYPYSNYFYNNNNNNYPYNIRPTLQTYGTNDFINYWQAWNQRYLGKK